MNHISANTQVKESEKAGKFVSQNQCCYVHKQDKFKSAQQQLKDSTGGMSKHKYKITVSTYKQA